MKTKSFAEIDETGWLEKSAQLLRRGRFEKLDAEHLAQYLVDMAISDRRQVFSHMVTLLLHLLKWEYQPQKRSASWENTIQRERDELQLLLSSKTLMNHAKEVLPDAYAKAVKRAAIQTRLSTDVFPSGCPYTVNELLAEES